MSQTSYALTQSAAYEGARGDSRPADILPARNVSGGELPFGRFVKATTDSQGVTVLGASSDVIKGVTVLTAARMPRGSNWVSGAPVSTSATGIKTARNATCFLAALCGWLRKRHSQSRTPCLPATTRRVRLVRKPSAACVTTPILPPPCPSRARLDS